jgi:hypothetical protein
MAKKHVGYRSAFTSVALALTLVLGCARSLPSSSALSGARPGQSEPGSAATNSKPECGRSDHRTAAAGSAAPAAVDASTGQVSLTVWRPEPNELAALSGFEGERRATCGTLTQGFAQYEDATEQLAKNTETREGQERALEQMQGEFAKIERVLVSVVDGSRLDPDMKFFAAMCNADASKGRTALERILSRREKDDVRGASDEFGEALHGLRTCAFMGKKACELGISPALVTQERVE